MTLSPLHAAAALTRREQILLAVYADAMSQLPDKIGAITAAAELFADEAVDYALIGGLAVAVRSGVPRATLDVDFAIPTRIDRAWLAQRLTARGFRPTGEFAHSVNFEHASGEPVQLAFDAGFDLFIERAEAVQLGSLRLRVVTKLDLIAMKRRAAADPARRRSKALRDLADIALLEEDAPVADEGW
jgi:hypothetical protein